MTNRRRSAVFDWPINRLLDEGKINKEMVESKVLKLRQLRLQKSNMNLSPIIINYGN